MDLNKLAKTFGEISGQYSAIAKSISEMKNIDKNRKEQALKSIDMMVSLIDVFAKEPTDLNMRQAHNQIKAVYEECNPLFPHLN